MSICFSMRLQPFSHQVTGHACLLTTEDQLTICKALNRNEFNFYQNMNNLLKPFTPEFRGVVDVTVRDTREGKSDFTAHFRDERSEHRFTNRYGRKNQNQRSTSMIRGPTSTTKYRGLDPQKFDEVPGFKFNQYTTDIKDNRTVVSDVGSNPWVQRVQRIGRSDRSIFPSILLENIGGMFEKPCILDLKVGTRIYGNDCPSRKLKNHLEKNKLTTTSALGIRLTGLQVYHSGSYVCRDKFYGRGLSTRGLKDAMRLFFSAGKRIRINVLDEIYEKIQRLKSSLLNLDYYRLYGSSVVIIYEGVKTKDEDREGCDQEDMRSDDDVISGRCDVRVVDFAHCLFSEKNIDNPGPDDGFIFGLTNILGLLSDFKAEYEATTQGRTVNKL